MPNEIVQVAEVPGAGLFIPIVEEGLAAWNVYQKLCQTLLDDSDYATIRGKKHTKRSGWSKLRRAFNISTEIIKEYWEEVGENDFGYFVTVNPGVE